MPRLPDRRPLVRLLVLGVTAAGSVACVTDELDLDVRAALAVDRSEGQDQALAELDVTLELEAGRDAHAEVVLDRVAVYAPDHADPPAADDALLELELGFPDDFDPVFGPGERRSVILRNVGTRNGDFEALADRCGTAVDLLVRVEFEPVDGEQPGIDSMTVVVSAPLDCEG